MGNKNIATAEDVKGLLYIVDYVRKVHFPSVSKLKAEHYTEISVLAKEEKGRQISNSTITRIFNFMRRPVTISYEKLDDLTYWCFDGEHFNFKDFLKEKQQEIESKDLISQEELEVIIEKIASPNRLPTTTEVQTISLANKNLQLDLSEGYLKKFFDALTKSIGDFTQNEIELKNQNHKFFNTNNGRVSQRLNIKEEQRQDNIEHIVAKAIEFARMKESTDNEVDTDWITDFFQNSQDTSNEKMQYLWAKILANEIDKPGSFSRRAINTIKLLNPQEASIFSLLCNCLWEIHPGEVRSDMVLFKNSDQQGHYSDKTWGFDGDMIRHLEDIGLVHETFMVLEKDEKYNCSYFDNYHQLCTQENAFEIELIRLSNVGAEISDVVMTNRNEEYYQFTMEYLKNTNILVQ